MLLSTLILINIGFIAYFGTLFLWLHEDVRLMNDDIEREGLDPNTLNENDLQSQENCSKIVQLQEDDGYPD